MTCLNFLIAVTWSRVVENVEVVQMPICRISLSLQNTKNKQTAYGPSTKEEEKRKKKEDEEKV